MVGTHIEEKLETKTDKSCRRKLANEWLIPLD